MSALGGCDHSIGDTYNPLGDCNCRDSKVAAPYCDDTCILVIELPPNFKSKIANAPYHKLYLYGMNNIANGREHLIWSTPNRGVKLPFVRSRIAKCIIILDIKAVITYSECPIDAPKAREATDFSSFILFPAKRELISVAVGECNDSVL